MEESSRRDSRRIQTNSIRVLREFARSADNSPPPLELQQQRSRSTPKVTDYPWLTFNTPYSELSPSPTSSIEAKSTNFNGSQSYYLSNSSNSAVDGFTNSSKYDWKMHSLMLCRHILRRGLRDGVGSDIKVYVPAWDRTYDLHRLVLDQNPYFKLLLQGGFREAESNQVTLHFEDNAYITVESFQFVLEYLYGNIEDPQITQANVRQILATSSYFQLDVCGICVDYILKNLSHENVIDYLLFADELMVQGSDRICDAVFTYLCREAYNMDRQILVSLPLVWLQKVIDSDAFWVPSEYERYLLIQQIIQARYETYITSPSSFVLSDLDTNPNCQLLSQSIYYMHMTFEQLESIQNDLHPLTKQRLVSEKVLKEALWMQVKLRSRIESASERDTKLNMTIPSNNNRDSVIEKEVGRTDEEDTDDDDEEEQDETPTIDRKSLSGKYFPIPTDDTTTYTGESAITLATSSIAGSSKKKSLQSYSPVEQYSVYPPFRFSVEFTDVNSLKHGMRVYSDTVFYAGSNWNMYIQKTRSQRKGVLQLGVYLHRQSVPQSHQAQRNCQHNTDEGNTLDGSASSSSSFRATTPTPSTATSNESWSFSRYTDKRKVVKTWFKIYCPSRGPKHALTLFQSSPDNFSVLQSWGWRSTTLCADEDASSSASTATGTTANTATTSDNTAVEESPPPLVYTPQTSNQLHYLTTNYDLRTIKLALPTVHQQKNSTLSSSGPTLRFTVVMGHV